MYTPTDDKSADLHYLAGLGKLVQNLLSQSPTEAWIEDLWQMYTGYTLFVQEAGYDPNGHDRFVSFRELMFFFQEAGKMTK